MATSGTSGHQRPMLEARKTASLTSSGVGFLATDATLRLRSFKAVSVVGPMATNCNRITLSQRSTSTATANEGVL